ncbi:MAG: hypothetical protein KAW12_06560 [Candidatus Aminicenantes bacterium]|nr:hypothetical protein [Candidatus Aminicenantes bacterium]
MNKRKKIFASLVFIILLPLVFSPLPAGERETVILSAVGDELARSMGQLEIENMKKPYYLEYTISDRQVLRIDATFGSLTRSEQVHDRVLFVGLRVGGYDFDNSAFLNRESLYAFYRGSRNISLEDDYNAIRHDIWLATDSAYKEALEQLAAKEAFIKNNIQDEKIPDFSKEKSIQSISPAKTVIIDRAKWEKIVKELSAIFRLFPAIHDSAVEMRVKMTHKYYVNSEGTRVCQPQPLVTLTAHAVTRTADGMQLRHYVPFYAPGTDQLPGEKQLAAGVKKMAAELSALAAAPVLEDYIGPVLFTGQASAELFKQVLVPQLSGERPPLTEPSLAELAVSSKLVRRMNRRILPREISISADPTRAVFGKEALIGAYEVDDQGVPARPVQLIESGLLRTLLMSRRPRKEIVRSNGHARMGGGGKTGVQIGNLFITAQKGKTYKKLKKNLLQMCKDQKLPFGLIIATVDDPAITGAGSSGYYMMRRGQGDRQMTAPAVMYRVYAADGREELVRGITISEIDLRSLKDIIAVGKDYYVHHCLLNPGGGLGRFSFAGSGGGLPVSITAPSVLIEEIEFKKIEAQRKNPPLLKHPYFPDNR